MYCVAWEKAAPWQRGSGACDKAVLSQISVTEAWLAGHLPTELPKVPEEPEAKGKRGESESNRSPAAGEYFPFSQSCNQLCIGHSRARVERFLAKLCELKVCVCVFVCVCGCVWTLTVNGKWEREMGKTLRGFCWYRISRINGNDCCCCCCWFFECIF